MTDPIKKGLKDTHDEDKLFKMGENLENVDGKNEMYILGSFLAQLFQIIGNKRAQRTPHDVLMDYIVKYSGVRRGIISPLLGFFYGLFVDDFFEGMMDGRRDAFLDIVRGDTFIKLFDNFAKTIMDQNFIVGQGMELE